MSSRASIEEARRSTSSSLGRVPDLEAGSGRLSFRPWSLASPLAAGPQLGLPRLRRAVTSVISLSVRVTSWPDGQWQIQSRPGFELVEGILGRRPGSAHPCPVVSPPTFFSRPRVQAVVDSESPEPQPPELTEVKSSDLDFGCWSWRV